MYRGKRSAPSPRARLIPAAVLAVVLLHLWRGNVLLSITGGTALYMLLVQAVFV